MHLFAPDVGLMGTSGIVGPCILQALGAAYSFKVLASDNVAVAFFGDGGSNNGAFHEGLNLASIFNLPVVFVCENNQYALSTSYKATTAVPQVAMRGDAYGIPSMTIDGNDVAEVYLVVREAVERARAGEGPTLIEAMTYRWGQHSMRANLRDPRPKEEFDKWMERDPIARMEEMLLSDKVVTEKRIAEIGNNVDSELATAVEFGTSSPQPTVQIMEGAVYAPHIQHEEPGIKGVTRELHYNEALNEAMHQEMDRDERVILMGEDVAETGGIFQVSKGLFESFGGDRVRDTPISEATFVGCGVGAAVAGMRPIVEIQIFDFVALTMDMIVNQAA